jgi:hypothetical protein
MTDFNQSFQDGVDDEAALNWRRILYSFGVNITDLGIC